MPLVGNLREYLLGMHTRPRYLFRVADGAEASGRIAAYWAERWVVPRLRRPETFEEMERHTLALPVRHGARVVLPEGDEVIEPLFEWT